MYLSSLYLGRACLVGVDVDVWTMSRWKDLEDGRRRGKKRGNTGVVKAFCVGCCVM